VKLIRTASLIRRQNDSIVHCEIELCASAPNRYLVNLRQGRMGEEWRETTRTPQAVGLTEAETLFQLAVTEKMAQGFANPAATSAPLPDAGAAPALAPAPAAAPVPALADADRALLQCLERGSWNKLSASQRKRSIWRVGERRLRAAVPTLVDLIERGDAMQDYCIAWAIGRCGDTGAAQAMRELHARGKTDAVRRMALQAWLLLAGDEARAAHAQTLMAHWPDPLRTAWARADLDALLDLAGTWAGWPNLAFDAWLEQLDQAAQCEPLARQLLLVVLHKVPLRAGTFRAVRHIYKMAEMRADAEVFGLLQRRFETTRHVPEPYLWINGRYRSYRDEASRPDSTVAYGPRTRQYLLTRGWRILRRLGEDGAPDFIPMALGALAVLDDRDAGRSYRGPNGRIFDRYGHWALFNHLLRPHAGLRHTRSGLSWYRLADTPDDGRRHEAFPAIWDRHPDALLWLMRHSRCEGVHAFAARALIDNDEYTGRLSADLLRELLGSRYAASARFAFEVVRRRFEPGLPDAGWLMLLVQSTLPEAAAYAADCLGRAPGAYAGDALLVATVLHAPVEALRRQGWILCQAALKLPGQPEAILLRLLDWLDTRGEDGTEHALGAALAADLLWALDHPLRDAAAQAPYERLLQLLMHRAPAVRLLAGRWLLLHAAPAAVLPAPVLAALLRDPDPAVRGIGVQLFGALPDHLLSGQAGLVAAFAVARDAPVRRGLDTLIARLGPADPAFRDALLPALVDALFRAEQGEGLHADLVAWITGPLAQAALLDDPDLLRRLLAARSKGAQLLGAALIGRFTAAHFDIADWAAFGRNQNAAVRRWAYAAFTDHPERVRAQLEAALRLFDSRFDDTLEFATAYFGSVCRHEDWTPLLLVNLCDHPAPAAQRFGRAMITAHFDVADVTEFMFKLSQHPSANMQLFVSAWLESASGGDVAKLRRLEPYFLGVLSQVNRGRVVKNRVLAFLHQQAMQSEEIAAFVARIFARQVLTVAIADKARYIEGLRAIQQRYPQLPPAMQIHAPPALAPARHVSRGRVS